MTARWELEDLGVGRLGIRNANDERSPTKALIRLLDTSTPVFSGRTGTPACWSLHRRQQSKPSTLSITSFKASASLQASTIELEDVFHAHVYDTGGFPIGRFKLSDSFMEELHGRYRRTNPQVHGSPFGQSSPSAGLLAITRAYISSHAHPIVHAREPERSPIENAGIRAGEITGWRCWRVKYGFLHSAYMQVCRWPPRHALVAKGMTDHENGIYVLDNEKAARDAAMEYSMWDLMSYRIPLLFDPEFDPPACDAFVIGTALLWGDVVEHERGWRASRAKVKSIDSVVFGNVDLSALREKYGV